MAKRVQTLKRNPDGNPKYRHVKPVVDSGASVTRYLDSIEKLRRDYRIKRNEIFRRINVEVFVNLVIELNSFDYKESPSPISPISDGGDSLDTLSVRCEDDFSGRCDTARSTLHSVVTGMGELDLSGKRETRQVAAEQLSTPYLLLDVRERDCYQKCHIITAVSYPAIMLTRSINYETPALLQFKNKPEKIIILYDEDELVATGAASTFVQRGYENIYILSGGLKVACKRFPVGLVIGRPPAACAAAVEKPSTARKVVETVLTPKEVDWMNCRDLSNNFTHNDVDLLQQQMTILQLLPGNGLSTARSWTNSSAQSERSRRSDASKNTGKCSVSGQRVPWK